MRVTLGVSDLVLANSLSPDLRLECIPNKRRPGGLSGSGYLVDDLEEAFVDGHPDRLHRCVFKCGYPYTSQTTSSHKHTDEFLREFCGNQSWSAVLGEANGNGRPLASD